MDKLASPLLPPLGDAELRAIFRNDERAIWRYQLLAAVLQDGYSAREAAERFQTTPETVRTLRAAFLESGHLDVLRSKRRGAAGHLKRQTPLAQAVAQALAADPTASGGTIWRRIQSEFQQRGMDVPRRSVYRLLDQLRPQIAAAEGPETSSELWPPALVPSLRAALPLLSFDPPLDLGGSSLAEQLLPDERDPLARGRLLRNLLVAGLEALRPGAEDDSQEGLARSYHILVGEALHGAQRDELQRELAIASATYTRAKRHGLERLAEVLVRALQRQKSAATRVAPPSVPPLLGRERELQYYEQRLQDERVAVIWGLAGCGKTAVAATLATQRQTAGDKVIWHSCSGNGEEILHRLLLSYGVEHDRRHMDAESLLAELRAQLRSSDLLVLETFEAIAGDRVAGLLIALLRTMVAAGVLRLLIVSRALPTWAENQGWLPLGGVGDDAGRSLWTVFGGQAIESEAWPMLYNRTLGYPRLLQLLAADIGAPLETFLHEHVCDGLSTAARQLLFQALLARRPLRCTTSAAGVQVYDAYLELQQRGLLIQQSQAGCYHLHGLLQTHREALQAFIPDALALQKCLANTALAGGWWLDAALYFNAAGDPGAARAIISTHLDELISRRQAPAALDLLKTLLGKLPVGAAMAEVQADLGSLHLVLGAYQQAIDALDMALALSTTLRDSIAPADIRRWHRLLAEAYLQTGQWRHALSHIHASMTNEYNSATEVSADERFEVILVQQRIWALAGHGEKARFWLAQAQMQLQAHQSTLHAALVAYAEGVDAAHRGVLELAVTRLRAAISTLPLHTYHSLRCEITVRLAECLAAMGQWEAARPLLVEQLSISHGLGHRSGTATIALALVQVLLGAGALVEAWTVLGQATAAIDGANPRLSAELALAQGTLVMHRTEATGGLEHLTGAIALASDPPLPEIQVRANLALAFLCLRQGDATTAAQYAARAMRLATTAGLQRYRTQAQLLLAQEALLRHAWDEARTLIDSARLPAADPLLDGEREHLQAELRAASGDLAGARVALAASLHLLQPAAVHVRAWAQQRYETLLRARGL